MKGEKGTLLIVDDERRVREFLRCSLESLGYRCHLASCGKEALRILGEVPFTAALVDLKLASESGIDILCRLKGARPELSVIIMTAYASVDTSVEAMKRGALDYLIKPFEGEQVDLILQAERQKREILSGEEAEEVAPTGIVGTSAAIRDVVSLVRKVAPTSSTVLIQGESGTGKELVAQAVHLMSPRAARPFIVVDCGTLREELLASELFGHKKGSFTGAVGDRRGLLLVAGGGTIFLDEIGNMSLPLQANILRAIDERRIRPVGQNTDIAVDVRVLAATNTNLRRAVDQGLFRSDLFYRLNVISIYLPPLRERPDDIPLLLDYFLDRYAREFNRPAPRFSPAAVRALQGCSWRGNIRELQNLIRQMLATTREKELQEDALPAEYRFPAARGPQASLYREEKKRAILEFDRIYIGRFLRRFGGNVTQAAREMGISREALHEKMRRCGLRARHFRSKGV